MVEGETGVTGATEAEERVVEEKAAVEREGMTEGAVTGAEENAAAEAPKAAVGGTDISAAHRSWWLWRCS